MSERSAQWLAEAQIVSRILAQAPKIDRQERIGRAEFEARQRKVIDALAEAGVDAAFVYSDEHYDGDVPYLVGNTNISVELVAGVIGRNGFHVLAGLEGGYVAEQLASRSGAPVHEAEIWKLVDKDYPSTPSL
jgi:hypothetical protein